MRGSHSALEVSTRPTRLTLRSERSLRNLFLPICATVYSPCTPTIPLLACLPTRVTSSFRESRAARHSRRERRTSGLQQSLETASPTRRTGSWRRSCRPTGQYTSTGKDQPRSASEVQSLMARERRFNHVPWNISYSSLDYIGHFLEVSYVFNLQNDE